MEPSKIEDRLDCRFYKGEDLYSDGEVEDRLLEIVKNHSSAEYNSIIRREKNWPVLYHLSNIRENILNWFPFQDSDDILEIGAGCGAVTGAFASKVHSVTCVDLSKKRSTINAYKNKEHDNIRYLVGNFEDVEAEALEQYDVITLIGVLEYAQFFIHSSQPFQDFLKKIATHLKPGGKIIIAIENRLGLKYWAGCTEDHVVGGYYEGIEGYPRNTGPRTFSRKELSSLITETGHYSLKFYYPHPDYKFPMALYSDARLPKRGELNHNYNRNFDHKRINSFNEDAVFNTLIENDLYPEFANSFLAIVSEKEADLPLKTLSIKFSNERAHQYAIMTSIEQDEKGKIYVMKKACSAAGSKHISDVCRNYELLRQQFADTEISINKCVENPDGSLRFEYIDSDRTVADEMHRLLKEKDYDAVLSFIKNYKSLLSTVCKKKVFCADDSFRKVFGEYPVSTVSEYVFEGICDVDLIFENILLNKGGYTLIDYEWTFRFDVPLKYVIWRAVYFLFLMKKDAEINNLREKIYAELEISNADLNQYRLMEDSFQKYVKEDFAALDELYYDITPGYLDVKKLMQLEDPRVRTMGLPQNELQLSESKEEIRRLNQAVLFKNEQIQAIYDSTSWKVTKPLRKILDIVRKTKNDGE